MMTQLREETEMLPINRACHGRGLLIVCGLVIWLFGVPASGQADRLQKPGVTTDDIVRQLVDHN